MFYNTAELTKSFYTLQDAVFEFYSDVFFDDEKINERALALHKIIDVAFESHDISKNGLGKEWLKTIVDFQLQRITERIKIEAFKNTTPDPPFVRIGPLDYELHPDEYQWFKEVYEQQGVSMTEWTANKMSATAVYFPPIKNKHWIEFGWGYNNSSNHGVGYSPTYPDFSLLTKIKVLRIRPVSSNLTISANEQLEKLSISGEQIEQVVLEGNDNLQVLTIHYLDLLKTLDITKNRINNVYKIDASGSKNITVKCSEAQYKFSDTLRKCRVKKVQIPAQSEEIDFYARHYNWDNGYSFLKWVIKHKECQLATALTVFWLGKPMYFINKSAEDVEDYNLDNYKLLKQIEKRVLQKKYKSGSLSFNITDYLDSNELETAKQSFPPELLETTI